MSQPGVKKDLTEVILNSISKIPQISKQFKNESVLLDIPKDPTKGDLTTNICFKLSGTLKQAPLQIASLLVDILKKEKSSIIDKIIGKIEPAGAGYINFFFKKEYFYDIIREIIQENDRYGSSDLGIGKKVLIEFVSANPTGPLSIAHARQAAVGDALANIMSFLGYDIKREYYINDEGNQINILGASVQERLKELRNESSAFKEEYYQGEYIYDLAKNIIDKKLNFQSISEFSAFAVDEILKEINKDLEDFGVKFDTWYSQKKLVNKERIMKSLDFLKEKGVMYENEGALWFKSTQFGDDKDRVVIKNDKEFTYLAADIAYHQDKFKRGYQWLINMWGPDHHGYIARLKAAAQAMGKVQDDLSIIIVQLATIYKEGKPVSMSTRRGQYISLREILDEVGRDAARFFFMMRKTSSHLDFDLDLAKKQSPENPVYYIQYAHARVASILANAKDPDPRASLDSLKEPLEIDLMRILSVFPGILEACSNVLDPCGLTNYLQDVAKVFHKFYDLHRVLVEDTKLRESRLLLVLATKIVLANGLGVLGISRPEKM